MSDCPLNGPVEDFLLPLKASWHLARLLAKRANLSGRLPDIACVNEAYIDDFLSPNRCSLPLSQSLQSLDLSGNRITEVEALNIEAYVSRVSLAENPPITFARGFLQNALKKDLQLDLRGTLLTNTDEISSLFSTGALKTTPHPTSINASGGYACHDVISSSLRVNPHLFWPAGLCGCMEGYQGKGIQCRLCGRGFYNEAFNSSTCRACPDNSTSAKGTTSADGCQCNVGRTDSGQITLIRGA